MGGVVVYVVFESTVVEATVETLDLVDPELEVALLFCPVATEGDLRLLPMQHLQNLLVGHIAALEYLVHEGTSAVARTFQGRVRHERVAHVVSLTQVTVDATPAVRTRAGVVPAVGQVLGPGWPISVRQVQRPAQGIGAIEPAEPGDTLTLARVRVTLRELAARKHRQHTVEARRT